MWLEQLVSHFHAGGAGGWDRAGLFPVPDVAAAQQSGRQAGQEGLPIDNPFAIRGTAGYSWAQPTQPGVQVPASMPLHKAEVEQSHCMQLVKDACDRLGCCVHSKSASCKVYDQPSGMRHEVLPCD